MKGKKVKPTAVEKLKRPKLKPVKLEKLTAKLWALHERQAAVTTCPEPGTVDDERFLALGLGGEAGEVLNLIKKNWRGPIDLAKLVDELGDTMVYWLLLNRAAGFNVNVVLARALVKATQHVEGLEREYHERSDQRTDRA